MFQILSRTGRAQEGFHIIMYTFKAFYHLSIAISSYYHHLSSITAHEKPLGDRLLSFGYRTFKKTYHLKSACFPRGLNIYVISTIRYITQFTRLCSNREYTNYKLETIKWSCLMFYSNYINFIYICIVLDV